MTENKTCKRLRQRVLPQAFVCVFQIIKNAADSWKEIFLSGVENTDCNRKN